MDNQPKLKKLDPAFVGGWPVSARIESSLDALFVLKPITDALGKTIQLEISDINLRGEEFIGLSQSDVVGKSLCKIIPGGFLGIGVEKLIAVADTQVPLDIRRTQSEVNGQSTIYRIQVVPAGEGVSVVISDVTGLQQAKRVLVDNQLFIEKLAGSLPEFVYVFDVDQTSIPFRNRDFIAQLGYPSDTNGIALLALADLLHPDDHKECAAHMQDVLAAKDNEVIDSTYRFRTVKGDWRWFEVRTTVFRRDERKRPTEFLRTIQDVSAQMRNELELREMVKELKRTQTELRERQTQLQQLNQQLASLATTDGLTSLYNFRAFNDKLAEETRRAKRYGYPLSVVMADIDDFKIFNDRFGHPAGDERLRFFAKILREGSRKSDFIARYGGEEFAIILTNTSAAGAAAYSQGVIDRLNEDLTSKRITASFGCVEMEPSDLSKDDLIRRADECLYAAKRQGKNRVVSSVKSEEIVSSAS